MIPAIDLQKLVECPLFPTSGELHDLYQFVLGASMGALGLFLAFNLAWAVVGREDVAGGLVQSLKDAVVVVALALLAPYAYNATASVLNAISYQLVGRINVGWVFACDAPGGAGGGRGLLRPLHGQLRCVHGGDPVHS